MTNPLEAFIVEPFSDYLAKSKDYLTSHQLADFRRSPILYKRKKDGLIPRKPTAAMKLGTALHSLLLEGEDVFKAQYNPADGPINPKTEKPYGTDTIKHDDWLKTQDQSKEIISKADYSFVSTMTDTVRDHKLASDLLSTGVVERVIRTEIEGVACQSRFDWYNTDYKAIVDVKTCVNLDRFERQVRSFGYVYQLAFYCQDAYLALLTGYPRAYIIGIEKEEPFRCGVWQIETPALDMAMEENLEAIERLKDCQRTDTWPTGYEDLRAIGRVEE